MNTFEKISRFNRRQTNITLLLSVILTFFLCNTTFAQRADTVINDSWRFYKGTPSGTPQNPGYDDSSWDIVNLPHTYNAFDTQDGGSYYRGPAWYRKNVNISSGYSGKRVYLFFEAVGKAADVYCNGTFIGRHEGAYAAFCFDITDEVTFGANNLIAVKTDNSGYSTLNIIPRSGDFNQYGGICRTLRLIITEPVHITLLDYASPGIYLTQTDVSETSADLEVRTVIRNDSATSKSVTVRSIVKKADDSLVTTLTSTQSVGSATDVNFIQNTTVSNPHLWNGRVDPYLYKVVTEIEVSSVVVDSVEQPLGFRYFSVDPNNGFFLNGQYLDLHGVAMHEDRRDKGRAISDADREQDIALMLEMGCTWIRPSHYQHAEKFYDLCDESGIVLSTEIPIVDSITFDTAFVNNCKDQLRELIRQNYNHPSVFFWLLYNELTTSGSETVIQQLHDLAKAEDPTRLTTVAHNNTPTDYSAWSYITDTLAYNRYFGWYGSSPPQSFAPWADDIHVSRATDEIGIMEYGAGANPFQHQVPPDKPEPYGTPHPEEYQSYLHEVHWIAMKTRPFLWCKTIWNGFDFAVDWRDEGDQIALNDKGMVTRDREIKKDAFYWYKANWTTEPMVYITSRRFTPQNVCPQYVKIYSNCDTVELFINDASMGIKTGTDRIFNWDNSISLIPGENIIEAVGVAGANECNDLCIWELDVSGDFNDCSYVRSINCGYISDFNSSGVQHDCVVDNHDFAIIADQWMDNYIETVTPTDPGTDNLVAYWSLDDHYNDSTGNHNASAIGGTLTFIDPGHSGKSVDFDGASALDCASSTNIDLTGGATISAWIKSDYETDSWACVVAKGLTAWRLIRNDVGSTMCFHFNPASGGTEFQANGSTAVLDGDWHHLMAVNTGSEIRLYVDGELDASTSTGEALRTSSDPVYIGSRVGRLSDRSWNGQIDEVRIYDRALNDNELLWLSEGEPYSHIPDPPRPTDLVLDGQIDMDDLRIFVEWWLKGTD